jgi:flagellar FliJ protein
VKKFRFRLEALLKLREQREKERQRELADAVRKTNEQRARLDAIANHTQQTQEYKRSLQSGSLAVHQLQLSARFLGRLMREALGTRELLQALNKAEAVRREALLAAARDKKIYENLKQRRQTEHYLEAQRLDQKEADEIGLSTYRIKHRPKSGLKTKAASS